MGNFDGGICDQAMRNGALRRIRAYFLFLNICYCISSDFSDLPDMTGV